MSIKEEAAKKFLMFLGSDFDFSHEIRIFSYFLVGVKRIALNPEFYMLTQHFEGLKTCFRKSRYKSLYAFEYS